MLIGDPARTQADINFSLFGFSVRVHPFFWLIALVLGMGGGERADAELDLEYVRAERMVNNRTAFIDTIRDISSWSGGGWR